MTKISAVIITLNEERNIGRCILSLDGVADEVLIMDSNSTDGTQDIATELGAKVIPTVWEGYATTKNKAYKKASGEYILWLDADEALSEELQASILKVKADLSGAYEVNRLNNYCGSWLRNGGLYPDRKVRLFPKGKAVWQGNLVHEELLVDIDEPKKFLDGDLLHYTYYTKEEHWQRAEKYARLASDKYAHKSKPALLVKMLFSPLFRFVKNTLFRLGFLDGLAGVRYQYIASWEVFQKYKLALQK